MTSGARSFAVEADPEGVVGGGGLSGKLPERAVLASQAVPVGVIRARDELPAELLEGEVALGDVADPAGADEVVGGSL